MTERAAPGERSEEGENPGTDEGYGGLLGAFPYGFRASSSLVYRSYVVVGGLVGGLLSILFLLALVQWVAATVRAPASVTLSRAFLLLIWLLVFGPLVAPVLLVARRHRRSGSDVRYDAAMGAGGFLVLASVYAGLVVGAPGRVVPDAYRAAGAVPPLVAVALLALAHRRLR